MSYLVLEHNLKPEYCKPILRILSEMMKKKSRIFIGTVIKKYDTIHFCQNKLTRVIFLPSVEIKHDSANKIKGDCFQCRSSNKGCVNQNEKKNNTNTQGSAQTYGSNRNIECVASMVHKKTQRGRRTGPSRLSAVHVVQSLITYK